MTKAPPLEERCPWCLGHDDYERYHDEEWGFPQDADTRLFEKLSLEDFQAGLSWLTILRKRGNFRRAFAGFDIPTVAAWDDTKIDELVTDAGIVRHRGKISATLNNARRVIEVQREFGSFAAFIWGFEPEPHERPEDLSWASLRTLGQTPASKRLSDALRKRGFRFVGPTTCYAFMQSMGLVNDHIDSCPTRALVESARASFARPQPTSSD